MERVKSYLLIQTSQGNSFIPGDALYKVVPPLPAAAEVAKLDLIFSALDELGVWSIHSWSEQYDVTQPPYMFHLIKFQ
jgi:hypothetical protein